jgi:FkbM family methyltransferase
MSESRRAIVVRPTVTTIALVVVLGASLLAAGWFAGSRAASARAESNAAARPAPSAAPPVPVAAGDTPPPQSASEMEYFRKRYGPDHHTEREEEWMIRDYFQDKRGGVFVDVGANHFRSMSKTYYLESTLGWSGIAIEPQREFAADYAKHRPRTKFFPFFVSNVSNATARLHMIKSISAVASSDAEFVKRFGTPDEVREVPTVTLTDLLDAQRIRKIDFMNMDIELHEPRALEGFDIKRFKPSLVCIEGLLPVRQAILDYFARNGYVLVGKYVWVDTENLYFQPLGGSRGAGGAGGS